MATLEQLKTALVNAHDAGDTEAATALADEIVRMQKAAPSIAAPTEITTPPAQDYQRTPAPGFGQQFGRTLASTADIVAGIVPAAISTVGYATSRAMQQTPERSTKFAQWMAAPFEQPFGRAFGVTETPEYKGEASRQAMDFIAQNVDKGSNWLATQTGLPKTDIENMLNTLTTAVAPESGRLVQKGLIKATEGAVEKSAQAQAQNVIRDKIWQESRDAGFVVPKSAVAPTTVTSIKEKIVGEPALTQKAQLKNQDVVNNLVRKEFNIDAKTPLSEELFEGLREKAGQAYDNIQKLPLQQVEVLNPNTGLMQSRQLNPKQLVDDWKQANFDYKDYNRQSKIAGNPEARAKAQEASARMEQLQNEIEQAVNASGKPELLTELRKAKVQISKLHAVEDAFNPASQNIDATALARIEAKFAKRGAGFTDNLKTITNFVNRFPSYFKETSKMRSPGGDIYDVSVPVLANVLNAPVTGILGAARAPARNLMLSNVYQNALVNPNYRPNMLVRGAANLANAPIGPTTAAVSNMLYNQLQGQQ